MRTICVVFTVVAATCANTMADITVFGNTFADNAFADSAVYQPGSSLSASELAEATNIVGLDWATECGFGSGSGPATLDVFFIDNDVVNGPGPDIAVYEAAHPEAFRIAIGGTTDFQTYGPAYIGELYSGPANNGDVNVAYIDLSAFDIPAGNTVDHIAIQLYSTGGSGSADLYAVGALNSVPEPAMTGLLALGGIALLRRRNK